MFFLCQFKPSISPGETNPFKYMLPTRTIEYTQLTAPTPLPSPLTPEIAHSLQGSNEPTPMPTDSPQPKTQTKIQREIMRLQSNNKQEKTETFIPPSETRTIRSRTQQEDY